MGAEMVFMLPEGLLTMLIEILLVEVKAGLKVLRLLNEQVCEDKRGLFGWFRQKLKRRRIESVGHSTSHSSRS